MVPSSHVLLMNTLNVASMTYLILINIFNFNHMWLVLTVLDGAD